MNAQDLVGRVFGRAIVSGTDGGMCVCTCACGNEFITKPDSLVKRSTSSCGCYRRDSTCLRNRIRRDIKKQYTDLTGLTIGRLEVLGKSDKKKGKGLLWTCKCSCGNEIELTTTDIKQMNKISCGCWEKVAHKPTGRRTDAQLYKEVTGKDCDMNDKVIFLNGNRADISPENMFVISKSAYISLRNVLKNARGFSQDPEITKTLAEICQLEYLANKKQKEIEEDKEKKQPDKAEETETVYKKDIEEKEIKQPMNCMVYGKKLYSVEEVAELLSVDSETVQKLIKNNYMKCITLIGIKIPDTEIERFIIDNIGKEINIGTVALAA